MITESYPTTSVVSGASTFTAIGSASLSADHTYLICYSHDWASASAASGVSTRDRIRWTPTGGSASTIAIYQNDNGLLNSGGMAISTILLTTQAGTVSGEANHSANSAKTASNVRFKVYQLD